MAGAHYVHGPDHVDFGVLARGCRAMPGQVIVCENEGADWLPFRPFGTFKAGLNNTTGGSREVIWTCDSAMPTDIAAGEATVLGRLLARDPAENKEDEEVVPG